MGFLQSVRSVFSREEKRAITSLPWIAGGPRASQVSSEQALGLIPYFSCVRLLADQVSALPLDAYRQVGDEKVKVANLALLKSPAVVGTNVQWIRQLVISLAMRGNAYGLVTLRDEDGYPVAIEWLNPDEVFVDESKPTLPVYYWQGQIVPRDNIVHIAWFVLPGRVVGLSPVTAFANTIGVGLQATQYGASWFENGGVPPGTLKNTQVEISAAQAQEMSDGLAAAIRKRRPIVYGKDWDFTALKVSPEESQFIETMKLNATQIAAIFGIPPEMVGGEAGGGLTYNTVEGNGLNLLKFVLRSWLVLIESAISAELQPGLIVQFNADAVVRADLKTRYEAHQIGLNAGFLTINDVRALEDLPPVEGGDKVRPTINQSPISRNPSNEQESP